MNHYFDFVITYYVLFNIGQWLLLFIQVWGVNRLLSKRLGSLQAVVKIVTIAITGVMAALTVGYVVLFSYNRWALGRGRYTLFRTSYYRSDPYKIQYIDVEHKLAAAYWILYLLSVLAGGAISLPLLMKMRAKSIPVSVSTRSGS